MLHSGANVGEKCPRRVEYIGYGCGCCGSFWVERYDGRHGCWGCYYNYCSIHLYCNYYYYYTRPDYYCCIHPSEYYCCIHPYYDCHLNYYGGYDYNHCYNGYYNYYSVHAQDCVPL